MFWSPFNYCYSFAYVLLVGKNKTSITVVGHFLY
uniref:Uncharacterized protein n=1 Tax=Rhizophora mucronata TaxID=61149 RepID=A0A2P2QQR6_RHIMU